MHYLQPFCAKPAEVLIYWDIRSNSAVTCPHIKSNVCFNLGAQAHTQSSSESHEGDPPLLKPCESPEPASPPPATNCLLPLKIFGICLYPSYKFSSE